MRVIRADSPEAPQARYVPAPVAVVARRPHDAAPVLVVHRKRSSVLLSSCTCKLQLRDPLKGTMYSAVHGSAQETKFHAIGFHKLAERFDFMLTVMEFIEENDRAWANGFP